MKFSGAPSVAQSTLVRGLTNPDAYDHPVARIRVIETHISYVLLTGTFAYKIKKSVSLGFADFSTLDRRRRYCDEEVRLNARLAKHMYLGVVPIRGTVDDPAVNGTGDVIEYAVKMRQFPDECRLDRFLERGQLEEKMVRQLAEDVATFHTEIPAANSNKHTQTSEQQHTQIADNFDTLEKLWEEAAEDASLKMLRRWSFDSLVLNGALLRKRRHNGFVRECHGDMHLSNMAYIDDKVTVYDALEFNADLRWIDVMSEVAFVVMDFMHYDRPGLASVFLSTYLETTGDYEGLMLLRHFLVYRAMVRAKVSAIRAGQDHISKEDRVAAQSDIRTFVNLAKQCIEYGARPFVLITCGVSGSGKSVLSGELVGRLGAVRIRSDVERHRRLRPGEDRYSGFARHRTYGRLEGCAETVLSAGFPVIADATFITRQYRQRFHDLASEHRVPYVILSLKAPREVLVKRIRAREAEGGDPSEATVSVLDRQLTEVEPFSEAERQFVIEIESVEGADLSPVIKFIRRAGRAPVFGELR